MASHVLIIGHGFIGSTLAETLNEKKFTVTAVNRSGDSTREYPVLGFDLGETNSIESLRETLGDNPPDLIIHCASSGRGGEDAYRTVFLEGAQNLLAVFPGTPLVFTSSTSVYGQTDGSLVDESSPTEPETESGNILVETEKSVLAAQGIVLRLAGLYGPGRSIYLQLLLQGKATIEAGSVSRILNQIHRDDVVSAIVHLIEQGTERHSGRCFNVVDDVSITQRECYEQLSEKFDLPLPPEAPPNPNRKRAWTHKRVSNLALRETGWAPVYPSYFDALEQDETLVASIRKRVS